MQNATFETGLRVYRQEYGGRGAQRGLPPPAIIFFQFERVGAEPSRFLVLRVHSGTSKKVRGLSKASLLRRHFTREIFRTPIRRLKLIEMPAEKAYPKLHLSIKKC